jgi:triphosphatase
MTPAPVKWRPVTPAKHAGASDVFTANLSSLLEQMRANQLGAAVGEDPEYLHQLRVSVRRLRAILSLYAGLLRKRRRKAVAREFQWLSRALGPARDADVFVADIWPPLREALGEGPGTEALEKLWRRQQRRAAATAHRALASQRYRRLTRQLARWIAHPPWRDDAGGQRRARRDTPARKFGRIELERRTSRVRNSGRALGRLDAGALHRLRIDIKKLRYMMDTLSPVFNRARVNKMLETLSRLQDVLGDINDIEVAEQKLGAALSMEESVDVDQLRARFARWLALRRKGLKRKLQRTWGEYRRAQTFW